MSVNWSWKAKKGCIVWQPNKDFKLENKNAKTIKWNFYQANCLGCFIEEWKDLETKKDMYNFKTYFNNYEHLEKYIGLKKCSNGSKENYLAEYYASHHIKEIRLNTWYKDNLKIANLFTKAGFKVVLYYKEIK